MNHRHTKQGPAPPRLIDHRGNRRFGHAWVVFQFEAPNRDARSRLPIAVAADAFEAHQRADVTTRRTHPRQFGANIEAVLLDADQVHGINLR
ncbi:hypothetical protein GALL_477110 [mine drainage metagenome]|uniref:Uncharacterized protein n=1 Tax=mine drainage metagenome TaxID=410659 RepID=A0A1J5PSV2_9ZZZZ